MIGTTDKIIVDMFEKTIEKKLEKDLSSEQVSDFLYNKMFLNDYNTIKNEGFFSVADISLFVVESNLNEELIQALTFVDFTEPPNVVLENVKKYKALDGKINTIELLKYLESNREHILKIAKQNISELPEINDTSKYVYQTSYKTLQEFLKSENAQPKKDKEDKEKSGFFDSLLNLATDDIKSVVGDIGNVEDLISNVSNIASNTNLNSSNTKIEKKEGGSSNIISSLTSMLGVGNVNDLVSNIVGKDSSILNSDIVSKGVNMVSNISDTEGLTGNLLSNVLNTDKGVDVSKDGIMNQLKSSSITKDMDIDSIVNMVSNVSDTEGLAGNLLSNVLNTDKGAYVSIEGVTESVKDGIMDKLTSSSITKGIGIDSIVSMVSNVSDTEGLISNLKEEGSSNILSSVLQKVGIESDTIKNLTMKVGEIENLENEIKDIKNSNSLGSEGILKKAETLVGGNSKIPNPSKLIDSVSDITKSISSSSENSSSENSSKVTENSDYGNVLNTIQKLPLFSMIGYK